MAEARAVEDQDPVMCGQSIGQAAADQLLGHPAIAVKEQNRMPLAAQFDVVQAHTVHIDEVPSWRMPSFTGSGHQVIGQRYRRKGAQRCHPSARAPALQRPCLQLLVARAWV
jgi:hypothetical protein